MAGQNIQSISLQLISATTDFIALNSISVINQDPFGNRLNILDLTNGGAITLQVGESVTITSSTGFVLPDIRLDGITMLASVITT